MPSQLARAVVIAFAATAAAMFCAPAALSQVDFPDDQEPVEVPLAYEFGVGARAMGMGGAHIAIAEDASAIYYNPAGLAMIRRVELITAFSHQDDELEVDYRGDVMRSPLSSTKLHQAALSYPVPTYRGSFVLAFGYHRLVSLDRDYFRTGMAATQGTETESITDRGGLGMYSFAAAFDASPDISIGGAIGFLDGSTDTDYFISWTEGGGGRYWYTSEADIDGITGSIGMLYKFEPIGRFGLTVDFPRKMSLNGTFEDDEVIVGFDDDLTIPFSVSGGLAFTPKNLALALDLKFTDWSQLDYEGPVRVTDQFMRRLNVYDAGVQVRTGAEVILPNMPVRLRVGYIYDPIPYDLFFTDSAYFMADIEEERDFFTFGGGVILENSLSLDLAVVTGGFVRSARETTEDMSQTRVFVSAAYRY